MPAYYGVQRSREYLMHYGRRGMKKGYHIFTKDEAEEQIATLRENAANGSAIEPTDSHEMERWRQLQDTEDRAIDRVKNDDESRLNISLKEQDAVGKQSGLDRSANKSKYLKLRAKVRKLSRSMKGGK